MAGLGSLPTAQTEHRGVGTKQGWYSAREDDLIDYHPVLLQFTKGNQSKERSWVVFRRFDWGHRKLHSKNVASSPEVVIFIGGFRVGAEGAAASFFSCIFKTFLYDPNPSNRFSSVVIIIQSGWSEVFIPVGEWGTRPLLSEFSGSAPEDLYFIKKLSYEVIVIFLG